MIVYIIPLLKNAMGLKLKLLNTKKIISFLIIWYSFNFILTISSLTYSLKFGTWILFLLPCWETTDPIISMYISTRHCTHVCIRAIILKSISRKFMQCRWVDPKLCWWIRGKVLVWTLKRENVLDFYNYIQGVIQKKLAFSRWLT